MKIIYSHPRGIILVCFWSGSSGLPSNQKKKRFDVDWKRTSDKNERGTGGEVRSCELVKISLAGWSLVASNAAGFIEFADVLL